MLWRASQLKIPYSNVTNLNKVDIAIFSLLKYDVTDSILRDNQKIEVQYLRNLFRFVEIVQDART